MQKHIQTFDKEVQSIHRQNVRSRNLYRISEETLRETRQPSRNGMTLDNVSRHTVRSVPMFRNHRFTGRNVELQLLHSKFFQDQPKRNSHNTPTLASPIYCVIHGLGGTGKTQVALEYTYRYRDEYDAIFWISSETGHEIAKNFAKIAFESGLVKDDGQANGVRKKNQNPAIQEARRWLQVTDKQWLLVFDNVEDISDLEPYLPAETQSQGSVIVTTQRPRSRQITKFFYNIALESFSDIVGAQLLFAYLERDPEGEHEESDAREISHIVGGLPLAIALIGGYINESESTIAEFFGGMKKSSNALKDTQHHQTKPYERTFSMVFDIALKDLPQRTRNLIDILAFLNPDSIPEGILVGPHYAEEVRFLDKKADLLEMTRVLCRRQLIRREVSGDEPFLMIHRSLQWSIIADLSQNNDRRWSRYHQAFVLLRRGMPMSSPIHVPEPAKWPEFERYAPQVLSLRTHCLWPEPPMDLPVDFARMLSDLGTYMWHAGLINDGSEALETAQQILDERYVPEIDSLRSDILFNLGIISGFAGVSERAHGMERRLRALEIRRELFGQIPEDQRTRNDEMRLYAATSDVAFGYLQADRFEAVEEIMEHCLTMYKRWDSEEKIPYEYAKYYYTMALVRASQKVIDEAIEFAAHAVELAALSAGENHSLTQLWKFNFGTLLFHGGDVTRALEIHEEVLAQRKRVCGEFNGFTLESYSTCAALMLCEGDLDKARGYFECCLERRKLAHWNREGVGRTRYRFHYLLKRLGKFEEARLELGKAYFIRNNLKKECPDQFADFDPDNQLEIFDRMCSSWAGRWTGRIKQATTPVLDFTKARRYC